MGAAEPVEWGRGKDHKLKAYAKGDVARYTALARDVFTPGVPVAALLGFAANGNAYNTTGWKAGDAAERSRAVEKGRRPFVPGDPHKGYGGIGSDDLHELGYYGVEGGHCPTPCATDPDCPWVLGARSPAVAAILGRPGVEGPAWYGATADLCVIGVWNLARHSAGVNARLPAALRWDPAAPWDLWRWAVTSMAWSAGDGGAAKHVERFAEDLTAGIERRHLWQSFVRLCSGWDGTGSKHKRPSYSALRTCQKIEAGRRALAYTREGDAALAWMDDHLGADRGAVYAALVRSAAP